MTLYQNTIILFIILLVDDVCFVSLRFLCFLILLLLLLIPELLIISAFNGVSGGVESSIDSTELAESLSDLRIIGIPSLFTKTTLLPSIKFKFCNEYDKFVALLVFMCCVVDPCCCCFDRVEEVTFDVFDGYKCVEPALGG